ncbi:MAG TPA: hypothetical protein VNK04_12445 [Gemmataceae bacterium]|nr:hypothetical protein [Gemmataceae bacterium]
MLTSLPRRRAGTGGAGPQHGPAPDKNQAEVAGARAGAGGQNYYHDCRIERQLPDGTWVPLDPEEEPD